jgi:hypothetical protein
MHYAYSMNEHVSKFKSLSTDTLEKRATRQTFPKPTYIFTVSLLYLLIQI